METEYWLKEAEAVSKGVGQEKGILQRQLSECRYKPEEENIARIANAVQVIEVASVIHLLEALGRVAAGLFMTEG